MKNDKLKPWVRFLLVLCGLALIAVLFVPMWRIDLVAPQYPEGLMLLIYPDKLAGNVDIINGLNHYIGMKTLHTKDFVEFAVLPYIIGFFALFFIVAGLVARRKLLYLLAVLFVSFGVLAMYDFWRWEYNYGHNLNPDAAIIVPGMAYQPPLIGFKQLLNFGAYSMPDIGGWIFVAVGIILVAVGSVFLAKQMGTVFPNWLFTWPVLLIVIGFFGPEVKEYVAHYEKVWREEPLTYQPNEQLIMAHQNNGNSSYKNPLQNGKLYVSGAETDNKNPDYMDGAIFD